MNPDRSLPVRARLPGLLAGLALVLAACSSAAPSGGSANQASAPGVTATTVTVGSHQPLTGPAAPGYSEIAPASEAMFKYINSQGGVNGRTIDYVYRDDMYDPSQTVNVVKQLVLEDRVFAVFNGLGTPTHTKVLDYLNAQRVPDLFVASGCVCWNQPQKYPYTFGFQVDYVVEGKILGAYIRDNFPDKKVGYLLQDDDFGQDGMRGLDREIPASSVVDRETYNASQLSQPGGLAPQLGNLKARGANLIVLFTIPAATASALLTAAKLNFQAQWVTSNVGSDPVTLSGLLKSFSSGQVGSQLLEGMVGAYYLPSYGIPNPDPWIQLFKKVHDQYISNLPFDGNVAFGMAAAYAFAQALKAAGRNPTRQSIVQAVEAGGFRGPGLVPFSYSRTNHQGYSGEQVFVVKSGVATYVGNPKVTDDGAGAIRDYTTPPPSPGDGGILEP